MTLQSQAKDRKNPKRGESQALLSWCLEAASGFYLTLLQEICTVFDLDLPFRRYISFAQVLLICFIFLFWRTKLVFFLCIYSLLSFILYSKSSIYFVNKTGTYME